MQRPRFFFWGLLNKPFLFCLFRSSAAKNLFLKRPFACAQDDRLLTKIDCFAAWNYLQQEALFHPRYSLITFPSLHSQTITLSVMLQTRTIPAISEKPAFAIRSLVAREMLI